ncbi:efflux RND transporter periplasmic adaptor subunit [Streptomyces smyrnaeus]|uniref:efflux RND transporter periplasmic adaptor subunit n=1 Tax=Streptomyces TaxID=1883 RepID=UPI00160D7767|nr:MULTISPECIES: peptidoglycan-binding protein [unclassified Streptomyces]MBQ0862183.1 peptidoglycan-binding protein [Streptomyces sp. RK75]MBQ1124299.1 peptidoglycan-binding protein [Streptomyces sp. B15]MBQ1158039.1 peptidoglycan-binding protein [Streptomyces sp. A73]
MAALAIVIAVCGSTVFATQNSADDGGTSKDAGLPPDTAAVERGDLSESTQADGTIGYGGERKINAAGAGTLTWTAKTGSVVKRNGKLFAVDDRFVRLMRGSQPMYRTLKKGVEGADVRQLEENLAALGYTGFTVDEEYTGLTADAVQRWQEANGDKETGSVGPEDITFAPDDIRIESFSRSVGDRTAPGQPVLTTTGSERVVSMKLDVAESGAVKQGDKVTVELPDGKSAEGEIRTVGTSAEKEGGDSEDDSAKVKVTVTLDEPEQVEALDQAPVTVELKGQSRKDVLTVPVEALLAMDGGGFGVQVVEHGKARDVRVELGLFGQGRVEVSGGGLREGMKVGVPKI